MAKNFAGFTPQQQEVLARKLGFNGPMDQFQNFVQSNPGLQAKWSAYENKAKQVVSEQQKQSNVVDAAQQKQAAQPVTPQTQQKEQQVRGFAAGGLVTVDPNQLHLNGQQSAGTQNVTVSNNGKSQSLSVVTPNANSEAGALTKDIMQNPGNYVTEPKTELLEVDNNQLLNQGSGQASATPDVQAQQAGVTQGQVTEAQGTTGNAQTITDEQKTNAPQVDPTLVGDKAKEAYESETAVKGTVSDKALAEAVTADPSLNATVQGQLGQLMNQFQDGNVPAWAAGAVRNANSIMAKRGLGSSSMAASAQTQAAMESALEIAIRDAATYSTFEQKNLDNRQQAALQNAQAFLTMDLQNLQGDQQYQLSKMAAITQSLFSDQAAQNAASQFNASSQMQTDQFFAGLSSQVKQFNASQQNAMEQFNVSQSNAMEQFNAQAANAMEQLNVTAANAASQFNAEQANAISQFNRQVNEQREQFNANNRLVVDQSNAEWRRQVATANNATINENNRIAAASATEMTAAAYNNLMQRDRDTYAFLYQSSENALQRAADMVMAQWQAGQSSSNAKSQALGSLAGSLINGIFS